MFLSRPVGLPQAVRYELSGRRQNLDCDTPCAAVRGIITSEILSRGMKGLGGADIEPGQVGNTRPWEEVGF